MSICSSNNWLPKLDAGIAFCKRCNKTIKYGLSGKKAEKHSDDPYHKKNIKIVTIKLGRIYCTQ